MNQQKQHSVTIHVFPNFFPQHAARGHGPSDDKTNLKIWALFFTQGLFFIWIEFMFGAHGAEWKVWEKAYFFL